MSRAITLMGAKGGQGTTTVAAVLSVFAAGHRPTTLVVPHIGAAATLLGLPRHYTKEPLQATPSLWLATQPVAGTAAVVDAGTGPAGHWGVITDDRYAVVRGPCYLALAALLEDPAPPPAGIVLLAEKGRSLTARDVTEVTGAPVLATVPVTDAVARAVDAGLLLSRLHRLSDLHPLRSLVTPPKPHSPDRFTTPRRRPSPASPRQSLTASSSTGTDLPGPQCGPGGEGCTRRQTRRETSPERHVYRV